MQRRARIKAVANLSNVRRGTSKNNADSSQESDNSKKDVKDQLNDIQEKTSSENEQAATATVENEAASQETSSNSVDKLDDVNTSNNLLDKLNEKSSISDNSDKQVSQDNIPLNKEVEKDVDKKPDSFKTPVQSTPRAENATPSSNKFRKPKIAPRLNIARAVSKPQDVSVEKPKQNDVIIEDPILSPIPTEKAPESPINVFSPPSTPFSPPPNRQRPETPREITDSPGLIINHNLHYPPTPQSPFYPSPHSRMRTESLCSIKSTTVANLQPRKKVRTEDQKILDNKRESRERLSNKQIEKSQLRMFDMIYYNPTTNPMKPRATPTNKERSPKKIDLTMDLPPPTPPPKEPSNAIAVPQLKLNADGELVLDEASLVVENEEQKKNRMILANTNVVYHDELSGTYGYYKRQQRTKEWPQEETIKFYRCLNTVGTDFSLMLNLFPNRSRRDLKLKFKKEEKNNPNLVDKALLNHNTFDIEELQRELDEEDEIRKKEAASKSSEVKEIVKRKILKKQEAKSKARQHDKAIIEKILCDGDLVLNSVDPPTQELKENMEKSEAAGKRKRAPKRKNVKSEPSMEFKKIMLHAKINESISVNVLRPQESVPETSVTPKDPPEPKAAIIYEQVASSTIEMQESTRSIEHYVPNITTDINTDSMQSETSTIISKIEKEPSAIIDKLISDLPNEAQLESANQDTLLSKTGRFISDLITASYRDTQENENDYLMEQEVKPMDTYESNTSNVKKEESVEKSLIIPVPTNEELDDIQAPTSSLESTETNDIETQSTITSITTSEITTEIAVEQPILTAEPSLDPSIISGEPSLDPSTISVEPSVDAAIISVEPSYNPSVINTESSYNQSEISANASILTTESSYPSICTEFSYDPSINAAAHVFLSPKPSYSPSIISMEPSYNMSTISAEPSCDLPNVSDALSYAASSMSAEPYVVNSEASLSVQGSNYPAVSAEWTDNSVICTEPEPERICIEDTEPERICIENTEPESKCDEDTEPERICDVSTEPEKMCLEPEPEETCTEDPEPEKSYTADAEQKRICAEDTVPAEEEPLDDESFLNSLDLERLVIVVKQINGKDFYDIHETDGDMQNLSDKPLNLPRHIVDLIVDAMTQDD